MGETSSDGLEEAGGRTRDAGWTDGVEVVGEEGKSERGAAVGEGVTWSETGAGGWVEEGDGDSSSCCSSQRRTYKCAMNSRSSTGSCTTSVVGGYLDRMVHLSLPSSNSDFGESESTSVEYHSSAAYSW